MSSARETTASRSGLRPLTSEWDWQESAACRRVDPALFFSPPGERGEPRRAREDAAQKICGACPVRVECARFAMAIGEQHGTWGGTSERERVALLRRPRGRVTGPDRRGDRPVQAQP